MKILEYYFINYSVPTLKRLSTNPVTELGPLTLTFDDADRLYRLCVVISQNKVGAGGISKNMAGRARRRGL
jgi:hypothetical protein